MFKKIISKEIGQIIPGLEIHGTPAPYGVLNERSVRATAWIMFFIGIITMLTTFFTKEYLLLNMVVVSFFIHFFIAVFFGPKYSPLSFLGRISVKNQRAEYVWAIQKRFAWVLWLVMSFSVFSIIFIFWITWALPLSLCAICLLLMWMESSLGICVWCKIFSFLDSKWIITHKHEHKPACPGWACSLKR